VTTQYVADEAVLGAAGVTGINFAFPSSSELFERVAEAVANGRIVAPPITSISLDEVPAALSSAQARRASGKTVITL
jgi:threonine dehydrogenase-like Zn-dependent dehydrogenase